MKNLYIIGAGLSGLSSAYHFPGKSIIYEQKEDVGGTASSMNWEGFTFDYGPHVSFTKDNYVQDLFAKTVNNQFFTKQVNNSNYCQGRWVRHPAICNLCDFPKEVNRDALLSFLENREQADSKLKINNYKEWCELGQGKFFAENYTHVYTRKFWTIEPSEMTYQWAGERVARPSIKKVINGALGLQQDSGYYYTDFRYPMHGGYAAYCSFWEDRKSEIDIKFNHRITKIDLENRILSFENQADAHFDGILVSSLPLPEFVSLTTNIPENVRNEANNLRCTSIALINIAISDTSLLPFHWGYIYDEDIIFTRFTIYSNLSEFNAPKGCTSLQVEIPYSKSRPLVSENLIIQVIEDLDKCNIIRKDTVIYAWQVNIKYGYVIYDFNREKALKTIHAWMRSKGVEPVGRFGLWQYLWSDQAIKSGKQLVENSDLLYSI